MTDATTSMPARQLDLRAPRASYVLDSPQSLIAFIYTGVVAASIIFVAPLLVGAMISSRGLSEQNAGLMISLETASLSLSALLGTLWLNRLDWQRVTQAAALMLTIGNLASLAAESFSTLLICRVISGLGAGTFVGLTYGALAQSRHPDRNFGLFSMGQLSYAAAALWLLPYVIDSYSLNGIYVVLTVLSVGALFMYRWMPREHGSASRSLSAVAQSDAPLRNMAPVFLMLLAIFLYFVAQSSIWTYAERIGLFAGFELADVGTALAVGAGAGFAGASFATWLNKRYGRVAPITLMISVKLTALYFLVNVEAFALFVTLICMLKFSWNFLIPCQLGLLSEIDSSGKSAVVSSFITGMGLSAGAAMSAVIVNTHSYSGVTLLSAACCLTSLVLMLVVIAMQTNAARAQRSLDR